MIKFTLLAASAMALQLSASTQVLAQAPKFVWKKNMPGLYPNVEGVTNLDFKEARKELLAKKHMNGNPDFLILYHPECPDSQHLVPGVKQLAAKIIKEKIPLNIIAVNMSKVSDAN